MFTNGSQALQKRIPSHQGTRAQTSDFYASGFACGGRQPVGQDWRTFSFVKTDRTANSDYWRTRMEMVTAGGCSAWKILACPPSRGKTRNRVLGHGVKGLWPSGSKVLGIFVQTVANVYGQMGIPREQMNESS